MTTKIKGLLLALKEIPELRYIAIDSGQTDEYLGEGRNPPIITPAVLLDIKHEETEDTKTLELNTIYFDIRLFFDNAKFGNVAAPNSHLDESLLPFAILDRVVNIARSHDAGYLGFDKGLRVQSLSELVLHFKVLS